MEPPQTPKYETDQCILVVGTTGTGKSSTIAKCTRQNVIVGNLADSVTKQCQIFPDRECATNPVWIDTVGYDDSSKVDDAESFKDVLRFIQEKRLLVQHVAKAIEIIILNDTNAWQRLQNNV